MSKDRGNQRRLSELLDMSFVSQTRWTFHSEMWHPWAMNGEAPELWGLLEMEPWEPAQARLECSGEDQFLGSEMWLSLGLGCEGTRDREKREDAEYIAWYFRETGPAYESQLQDPTMEPCQSKD